MIITSIGRDNIAAFAPLAPTELMAGVDGEIRYGLGAIVNETAEHPCCAGVLLFDVINGSNGVSDTILADIKWVYVAQARRRRGVATALLTAMLKLACESGVEAALCDLPQCEDYDEVAIFLEQAGGFLFRLQNCYELDLELRELSARPVMQHKAHNVCALRDIDPICFRGVLADLDQMEGICIDLPFSRDDYDMDVSCVYREDHEVTGALLVQRTGPSLELMAMRTMRNDSGIMVNLLLYAVNAAEEKYSPDTVIHIHCRTQASGEVLDRLFPDKHPPLIHRGFLILNWKEAQSDE